MTDIKAIQSKIAAAGFDGWLLTDFRGSNAPARRVLGVPVGSRRWWYWIPSAGGAEACIKLEPAVEVGVLSALPGNGHLISRYEQVDHRLRAVVGGKRIAMEYSASGQNPYVSHVDGGTLERVRAMGATIESSQDLLQYFDARWTDGQWQSHLAASKALGESFAAAAQSIRAAAAKNHPLTEYDVSAACITRLRSAGMLVDHLNTSNTLHSRLPHYDPPAQGSAELKAGDLVLMDHFCKADHPDSVFADYTRVFYLGKTPPARMTKAFGTIVAAREAAVSLVESAFKAGRPLPAHEVDTAARSVLVSAGYESAIAHRTGHNLGAGHVHGNGAHLDAVEHPDSRLLIPETAFTIEPGLYFEDFGVRTEINVYINAHSKVHLTGHRADAIETLEL